MNCFLSLLITNLLVLISITRGQEVSSEPVMGFQSEIEGSELVRTSCRWAGVRGGTIPNCPVIGSCSTTNAKPRPISTCLRNWRTCNGIYFKTSGSRPGCAVTRCTNPRSKPTRSAPGFVYLSCSHTNTPKPAPAPKPAPQPNPAPKPAPQPNPAPKPAPNPAPAPAPATGRCAQLISGIMVLMNKHRQNNGAKPLCFNAKLNAAAAVHSKGMVVCNKMTHDGCPKYGPDKPKVGQRIDDTGYRWRAWGENVAGSFPTAEAVFTAWKNSPGHNANMLNKNFNQVGMSVKSADGNCAKGRFYTQVFARSDSEPCAPSGSIARLSGRTGSGNQPNNKNPPNNSNQGSEEPENDDEGDHDLVYAKEQQIGA